jgi:hypothetical protein
MKLRRFSQSAIRTATALARVARSKSRQLPLTQQKTNGPTITAAGVGVPCRAVFAHISIRNACELTNGEGSRHGEEESRVGLNTGYKSNIATTAERGMQRCGRSRFQKGRVKLHKRPRSVTRQPVDDGARSCDQVSPNDGPAERRSPVEEEKDPLRIDSLLR